MDISKYRRFIKITERAEALVEAVSDWEVVYDVVFSDTINGAIIAMGLSPSYYDPDTTYEEDARAYVSALRTNADRYQAVVDTWPDP